jgi:hypothetical protein
MFSLLDFAHNYFSRTDGDFGTSISTSGCPHESWIINPGFQALLCLEIESNLQDRAKRGDIVQEVVLVPPRFIVNAEGAVSCRHLKQL